MKKKFTKNEIKAAVWRAIAQDLVRKTATFDAYLKKQNVPKIYRRFQKVIKIT